MSHFQGKLVKDEFIRTWQIMKYNSADLTLAFLANERRINVNCETRSALTSAN